jgi:NAD-dependent SIR2 family protein deacetylase
MDMTSVKQAADILDRADAVLIGAGAGMSAAAGLDYTDEKAFAERFPGMLQYGARYQYQLMGYPFPDEALKWGYLSVSLDHVYQAQPTPVYQQLRRLIGDRDYFVMTSNVDRYFHKNGFDQDRIFTPQGDYELFQCFNRCHENVWDGKPLVAKMLPSLNRETQTIEDLSALPTCPRCGGPVFMNVRGGDFFIEHPYEAQQERFVQWVEQVGSRRLAVLDIGTGFNTPGVIRLPMERIAAYYPKADLLRINRDYPQVPDGGISLAGGADEVLNAISEQARAA